ncbi:unnamed protein product [Arabis nemorensis]|uniref:PUM-HD domain-containing protein n=1 Tax=Arabis nemorensis TaxID=586526 RepID=A0A565ATD5_9BRAS|nr:unnamed protein product [Arabis nemorensis]
MMMRDHQYGEASSLSRSPSSPLQTSLNHHSPNSHRNRNLFPGDSSSRFSLRSPSPSYFSNGFCCSDDGSSQFASPPFDGIMTKHYYLSDHDLGLWESLHRLNIRDEQVEKTHHQNLGFRFGVSSAFGDSVRPIVHRKIALFEIQGYVYLMAKDQHGCRYLQRIVEDGTVLDAMIIFNEVIPHVVELMMDPFGNYLIQKLLHVCNEQQRTQIILTVTSEPRQLIRISLNAYGTRVLQRLVESIKTRNQISMVKSALRPGFLTLIRDLNGNHVIQRCLECLSTEDNQFIFDNATKFCIDIATHRHGCCVLQKCIAYSTGQRREKLITEISRNSLFLAQDPYGNYAVQFVIELREFSAISMVLAQLKGHYVELSMQKFSSHLVERCLTHCPESRPQIVLELISVPHFDHLIQDPYANFVIQAALAVTKSFNGNRRDHTKKRKRVVATPTLVYDLCASSVQIISHKAFEAEICKLPKIVKASLVAPRIIAPPPMNGSSLQMITREEFEDVVYKSPTSNTFGRPPLSRSFNLGEGSYCWGYILATNNGDAEGNDFPSKMAIKCAPVTISSSLINEERILIGLSYPYVVCCYGSKTMTARTRLGNSYFNLILEYCEGGSIADFLKN